MAAEANRTPREVVEFAPNVAVTLALKYAQGKTISNQYGERIMYSLTDGRVMFLDLPVAAQIEALGINVRESFSITKRWSDQKDSAPKWEVARVHGEQPNGTLTLPATANTSHGGAASPKAPASAIAAQPDRAMIRKPAASASLVDEANSLVDAYAVVLERTLTTYQGRIKPDEARSLLVTAYIQRNKLSSVA